MENSIFVLKSDSGQMFVLNYYDQVRMARSSLQLDRWRQCLESKDLTRYGCHFLLVVSCVIGADSMGAMGAIAPTAKKLWGRCPQVATTRILTG